MVDILALISSILFTPAFSISFFYETGVEAQAVFLYKEEKEWYNARCM